MPAVHTLARRVLLVVALLATMHGLVHVHAADMGESRTGQVCGLCVTAHHAVALEPAPFAPPDLEGCDHVRVHSGTPVHAAVVSLPSRAPPAA
jgi:hypothetical protein